MCEMMLYDKDIREPLFLFLEEMYGKVRIFEEKNMGDSRADAIMVTPDALYGIEIKSDADTYARLINQVKDYDKFFDYNYVVVGSKHGNHITEHVPSWWGIITVELQDGGSLDDNAKECVSENIDFYIMRNPKPNPHMDWSHKITLLWRPELVHIQQANDMPAYKDKSKQFVRDKILERIPEEILQRQLCEELFERDYSTIKETIREYKAAKRKVPISKVRVRKKYRRRKKTGKG